MVAVMLMIAGKGLTAVTVFGKKFRRIVCCQKEKEETEKESEQKEIGEGNVHENEGRMKRVKSRDRHEEYTEKDYSHLKLCNIPSESASQNKASSKMVALQSDVLESSFSTDPQKDVLMV
eukprot:312379_1